MHYPLTILGKINLLSCKLYVLISSYLVTNVLTNVRYSYNIFYRTKKNLKRTYSPITVVHVCNMYESKLLTFLTGFNVPYVRLGV